MMQGNNAGVAIFPAKGVDDGDDNPLHVRLDHFAFNVSNEEFNKAREYYDTKQLAYRFSDHVYFHSIYLKDPDGHTVELTTEVAR